MRKLAVAALAAACLAAGPGTASANHATGSCLLDSLTVDPQSTYQGNLVGQASAAPGEPVSIDCTLYVNGVHSGASAGFGVTLAAASAPVTFNAGPYDVVLICAAVTATDGTTSQCVQANTSAATPVPYAGPGPLGYISISHVTGTAAPFWSVAGSFAVPGKWTCGATTTATTFEVTCTPAPSTVLAWTCSDYYVSVGVANGTARGALDCDGGGAEVVSSVVSGPYGGQLATNNSPAQVSVVTCAVDGGPGVPATPTWSVLCGAL